MATMMAWAPAGQESLGAIQVPMGTALSNQRYWNLLGLRLKQMAKESSPQDLKTASELMVQSNLMELYLDETQVPQMMLWDNLEMKRRLIGLGVPGEFPERVLLNNKQAQMALENVTLLEWVTEIAAALVERD